MKVTEASCLRSRRLFFRHENHELVPLKNYPGRNMGAPPRPKQGPA